MERFRDPPVLKAMEELSNAQVEEFMRDKPAYWPRVYVKLETKEIAGKLGRSANSVQRSLRRLEKRKEISRDGDRWVKE